MKNCAECGAEVTPDMKFCAECGTRLVAHAQSTVSYAPSFGDEEEGDTGGARGNGHEGAALIQIRAWRVTPLNEAQSGGTRT